MTMVSVMHSQIQGRIGAGTPKIKNCTDGSKKDPQEGMQEGTLRDARGAKKPVAQRTASADARIGKRMPAKTASVLVFVKRAKLIINFVGFQIRKQWAN